MNKSIWMFVFCYDATELIMTLTLYVAICHRTNVVRLVTYDIWSWLWHYMSQNDTEPMSFVWLWHFALTRDGWNTLQSSGILLSEIITKIRHMPKCTDCKKFVLLTTLKLYNYFCIKITSINCCLRVQLHIITFL